MVTASSSTDADLDDSDENEVEVAAERARVRLYLRGPFCRVEASVRSSASASSGGAAPAAVAIYDDETRVVWEARRGREFERRGYDVLDYDAATRRRRGRIDLYSLAIERRGEWEGTWSDLNGSGQSREIDRARFGGRPARVVRLAVEPGVYWDVTLAAGDVAPVDPAFATPKILSGVFGVAPGRAGRLATALRELPVAVDGYVLGDDGIESAFAATLFDVRPAAPASDSLWPDDATLARREELDRRLSSTDVLLDAVSRPDALSTPVTLSELCLRIAARIEIDDVTRVVDLVAGAEHESERVELARALLRRFPRRAWVALRPSLDSPRIELAAGLVEALIAERHPAARASLLRVLRQRDRWASDVPPEEIERWALGHLRVLSGIPLARLLEQLPSGADAELETWLASEE